MDEEKKYWVAFSVFPGVGPARFKLLFNYFGSARAAWEAPIATLKEIGLPDKLVFQFADFRKNFDIPTYLKKLKEEKVTIVTLADSNYPKLLSQIPDAPFLLYVKGKKGKAPLHLDRTIGVVGTRKITRYGEEVTSRLVSDLVSYGFTIVSGMAYGVDAVAHQSALSSGGETIAVLGCGIDIIAPPSNARLYRAISEGGKGAIVSEMPLGLRPNKGLFPARNRIISGLSLGVVVTEGADDSGALITARDAAEQGREVFAVPGPITSPYSKGPAKLLKSGAKLVESVEDIVEELGIQKTPKAKLTPPAGATEKERKILAIVADGRVHIDEIVRQTGLTASDVAATLTVLEIGGIVKDYGEKNYGLV